MSAQRVPLFRKAQHIHFVGIGGSGMSGIAEVLLNLSFTVSGSDLARTPVTERLASLGATIHLDHAQENIKGAHVVVISSAVGPENPEVMEARRSKVPVIPRAEMLGELMRMKYGVAIAGSHGKTSTTAMVAQVLSGAGLDPTIVIGGRLNILDSSAKLGKGDLMVAEADESDGSFLRLAPTIAVVTNIDTEHLNHYGTMDALVDAFAGFLNKVPFYGLGIVCLDDPQIQRIMPRLTRTLLTYGLASQADLVGTNLELKEFTSRFEVTFRGRWLGDVRLSVPGRHSIYNALAAIGVGLEFDLKFPDIAEHLAEFSGADRRFQLRGSAGDILVIDDYGHHPTEIRATLSAARDGWSRRRVVVFQPHRYSRVQGLMEEFSRSFYQADVLIVTEIYKAGETPIPGVNGEALVAAIKEHGHKDVSHAPDLDAASRLLLEKVRPGDMVITLGAGDVWKVAERFLKDAS
ncbi:MAG TPA: UDP-N-acetylmuramate--L-alanine ligase [Candidatus Polarisedimenticolia bacterium]|nr:UDP-N-acetylmuramate--L-alanine ligase [Candidatus Polarisedimenticolia bacterium]